MRDLYNNLLPALSIIPAAITATATGTGVDLQGYNSAMVLISAGAWIDGTHTLEVQESDDDSTYTAVADADLMGDEPVIEGATDDDTEYRIGYRGNKRYLRVVSTVASATTGAIYGASIIRGNPLHAPV